MAISVGDKIPDVEVHIPGSKGPQKNQTSEIFGGKKTVLFSVPGAFTPLCSAQHLPGFIDKAAEIQAKGVDQIVCMAVNDAFVMGSWAEQKGAGDKIVMLSDGSANLTKAIGLEMDGSGFGMGIRSQRFAAIMDDGVVTGLFVEEPMKFEVSSAEAVLAQL